MSSLLYSCPPTYATAVPVPDYSRDPDPSERLVESSISPPPYMTRVTSIASVSSISSHSDYVAEYGSSRASSSIHSAGPLIAETPLSRYVYTSGNVELDLGPRPEESRSIPSYGRNGLIRGVVRLKKHSHVQAIVITLEGRAQTMIMQAGLASGHSAMKVLDLSHSVYEAKGKGKAPVPSSFPFEFEFPSTITDSTEPLPPTFRGVHPSMEGWIRYTVRVQVIKSGLWPRDTISTTVHYLPKFYLRPEALLWPAISLMDAKRFGFQCDKWKTTQARLLNEDPSLPANGQPELSIAIPTTAQAVAGQCFPINITIRVPGASSEVLSHYLDKLNAQIIKKVTMIANGNKSSQLTGFGKLLPQQIERELVSSDTRIWRGGIRGGMLRGEASWSLSQIVNVEYVLRVTVKLDEKKPPIFQHDEAIEMFTHSRAEYECPIEIHDAPAYNLLLGSSLHSNSPSLR